MHTAEQALISFFERVAQKDKKQLKKLREEQRFSVDRECWFFSLPDLYSFLQFQDGVFHRINYKQFRQLVFNSPIHKNIKSFGAEIIIADNQGKVDKSGYVLVWQRPSSGVVNCLFR